MSATLHERIRAGLGMAVAKPVAAFARHLGETSGAHAVLFYGSNLRTGLLDGVLDYYVLLPGPPDRGIWPHVCYREWKHEKLDLRAKVAMMSLATFARAARGETLDTTIWARFIQPRALAWSAGGDAERALVEALAAATSTAARLAVALGPASASEEEYWAALFHETYRAEFRVERPARAQAILAADPGHFAGLLPLGLEAAGIAFAHAGRRLEPRLDLRQRGRILRWWRRRRRLGKPLNLLRLFKAGMTFEGAARYAAWKIERHTGMQVAITPWRERHPVLAAPAVLLSLWRHRRRG